MINVADVVPGITTVRHLHCSTCEVGVIVQRDMGQLAVQFPDRMTWLDPVSVEVVA